MLKKAIELSRRFFGFEPRWVRKTEIVWPRALARLGKVHRLDYICDKFDGETRIYFHHFKTPVTLYAAPVAQKNGENLLIIKGKFKIQKEGITG